MKLAPDKVVLARFTVSQRNGDAVIAGPDERGCGESQFLRSHRGLNGHETHAIAGAPLTAFGILEAHEHDEFASAAALRELTAWNHGLNSLNQALMNGELGGRQVDFPFDGRMIGRGGP